MASAKTLAGRSTQKSKKEISDLGGLTSRLHGRVMSRSNNPEGQDSHEDMGNCRRVLIVLFCVSYLVRHPSTVDQTFAKLFPHNAAETS
jgi:hypothetical protein